MKLIEDKDINILKFEGEIVFGMANELKEEAKKLLDEKNIDKLIIDLTEVEFLDSSGIGVLISLFKNIIEKDGKLVIAAPTEKVRRVIELTRLEKIMNVYNSVDEAEEMF